MDINFNETFLDPNSFLYNYYIGIPNMEISNVYNIENLIKKYKKLNLDYLSINIFNLYLNSIIAKNKNSDIMEVINKFILGLSKKYKITFLFSYSISANPIAYFDCWNSRFIYKSDVKSIKEFSQYLINDKSSFLSVKKPHRGILSLPQTKQLQMKLCNIEICSLNDSCEITDFENIYYNLLDKGWSLGAISTYNSLDSEMWYTGIISKHSFSNMLINSIKENLTYSTRLYNLKFYFSINFIPMGKTLELNDSLPLLSFYIFVDTKERILGSIEIISNHKKVIKKSNTIYLNRVRYIFKYEPNDNCTWFVVRLLSNNKVLAISSPVFIKHKKSID